MNVRCVWMAGPDLAAPGGMSAVVLSYRDAGLFDAPGVHYLGTYQRPGLSTQLRVFGRACLSLAGGLLRRRVRLLHVHSASRGSFWRKSVLCAMARLFGVPYVFHIHSGEFKVFATQEAGPLARWWIGQTLVHAQAVLVLTARWEEALKPLAPQVHWQVMPNPIALPAQAPAARQRRRQIIFLGRIRQKKGAFDLLRAMALVLARVPDAHLVMAGDGEIDAGRALSAELGLIDQVSFTGWIEGVAKDAALQAGDVFVLPSYFEGLPIGILEAMAHGLVVVASPVGGVPDLLTDGVDGRLVAPGDVAALAQALVDALTNDLAADGLVAAAWRRVQHHDAKVVVVKLADLYARLDPAGAVA